MDKATFGEVMYRPVDKRENYVKRCIGMPGDTLQLIDNQVYIDGKPAENPKDMQFNYFIETDGSPITEEQFRLMDVSKDDRMLASSGGYYQNLLSYLGFTPNANGQYNPVYRLPLTKKALAIAEKLPTVKKVIMSRRRWAALPIRSDTILAGPVITSGRFGSRRKGLPSRWTNVIWRCTAVVSRITRTTPWK